MWITLQDKYFDALAWLESKTNLKYDFLIITIRLGLSQLLKIIRRHKYL